MVVGYGNTKSISFMYHMPAYFALSRVVTPLTLGQAPKDILDSAVDMRDATIALAKRDLDIKY